MSHFLSHSHLSFASYNQWLEAKIPAQDRKPIVARHHTCVSEGLAICVPHLLG
jgi:hypothetical protein